MALSGLRQEHPDSVVAGCAILGVRGWAVQSAGVPIGRGTDACGFPLQVSASRALRFVPIRSISRRQPASYLMGLWVDDPLQT
jgi:hypothetical protein